jgi:hypothetical protein
MNEKAWIPAYAGMTFDRERHVGALIGNMRTKRQSLPFCPYVIPA